MTTLWPHLSRVYIYWLESDTINLEAVETERRSRLLSFLYSDYTLITPNGEINAFYKNKNYEKHQKTRFMVSRSGFEPLTLGLEMRWIGYTSDLVLHRFVILQYLFYNVPTKMA
jgi:hypothetical protein